MEIKKITDPAFKKYGRVVENVDFTELVNALKQTEIPTGVAYEPSVEILENTPAEDESAEMIAAEELQESDSTEAVEETAAETAEETTQE